ncbi:hypothetical protein B0T24DRAFT_591124 [Lasiosphaeria ovina]|uniref:Uncharacterized protein n=1 Tax=Lasiosphaeria ovina TaxID=92902 RepID=A0AAE0NFT5_9PEZI|nr:hypothetical protein B0T24DRAFT_591124 [Lasiosphaeria ovina]
MQTQTRLSMQRRLWSLRRVPSQTPARSQTPPSMQKEFSDLWYFQTRQVSGGQFLGHIHQCYIDAIYWPSDAWTLDRVQKTLCLDKDEDHQVAQDWMTDTIHRINEKFSSGSEPAGPVKEDASGDDKPTYVEKDPENWFSVYRPEADCQADPPQRPFFRIPLQGAEIFGLHQCTVEMVCYYMAPSPKYDQQQLRFVVPRKADGLLSSWGRIQVQESIHELQLARHLRARCSAWLAFDEYRLSQSLSLFDVISFRRTQSRMGKPVFNTHTQHLYKLNWRLATLNSNSGSTKFWDTEERQLEDMSAEELIDNMKRGWFEGID